MERGDQLVDLLAAGTEVPDPQGLALLPDTRYYSLDHSQLADEVLPVDPRPPAKCQCRQPSLHIRKNL